MANETNATDDSIEKQVTLTGEDADAAPTDAEMKRQMKQAIDDHDAVFLVAGSLEVDEDGDDGVSLTVARFVADDAGEDDDDRASLAAHVAKEAMEHAVPGGKAKAIPVPMGDDAPEGLAGLLSALAGSAGVSSASDPEGTTGENDPAETDNDRMYQ